MHLALAPWNRDPAAFEVDRRRFLTGAAAGLAAMALSGAGVAPALGADAPAAKGEFVPGTFLDGKKSMDFQTGQEWIRTFFESATTICKFYADEFTFEDVSLFQTISDKKELYAAFAPFENKDPKSPIGVHYFDVVRYDGYKVPSLKPQLRKKRSDDFTDEEYEKYTRDIFAGSHEYDEFGMMQWIWKAIHTADFLGMPAAGKTTICRGITYHGYRKRRIVREFTYWNTRDVAVQLGVMQPPLLFWKQAPAKA